jgi:hypothetical protein
LTGELVNDPRQEVGRVIMLIVSSLHNKRKEEQVSEEKIPPPSMLPSAEISLTETPLAHRDGSLEYAYLVAVSPDLPSVRLRVFIFPNGDAQVEAEFGQPPERNSTI